MTNNNPKQATALEPRDLSFQYQALRMKWEAEDKVNDADDKASEMASRSSVDEPPTDFPYPALRAKGLPGTTKVTDRPTVPKLTINTKVPPMHKHPWNQHTHRPKAFMRDRPHLAGWESGTTPDSVTLATHLKGPSEWDTRHDTEPPTPA
ncbi:hypothetical protein DL546_005607 [Coniochaeta pulveracea]|uniref:Uncharacterized protein n=1 Tax=Coniochaeta pulveracea TaxID=177199 RepID=A0A420Y2C1_9PEZI|nr:hypothetical protein DL546_005607 [Coniochaeta pulveracea]